jgi:hypothetical protein
VANDCASATFPFASGGFSTPSPSSQTYNVFASAKNIPNGKFVFVLASVLGNPGKMLSGTVIKTSAVPVGNVPGVPA